MKFKEITAKSDKELKTLITEKRASLREFRFGISGAKNRNVKNGKALRKDVARILTKMNTK